MAATPVQAKDAIAGDIDTLTFDTAPTAGNLLIARLGTRSSSHAPTDISADWISASHTAGGTQVTHLVYRVADGTSADNGPGFTNVGTSTRAARIEEWSGIDVTSSPLDVTAENAGSGDPIQSGTTPASAAPVIAFVAASDRERQTFDGGWSNSFTTDWIGDTVAGGANREVSTSTQFQTDPTYSGAGDWAAVLAVFLVEDAVADTFTSGSQIVQATVSAAVHELTGSVSGVGALAGTLVTVHALSGTVVGAATLSGDITAVRDLSGTLSGVGSLSGDLVIRRVLEGSLAGTATLAGTLEKITAAHDLTGSVAGTGALAADLTPRRALTGALQGTGTLSGDLLRTVDLAGAIAGQGTLTGNLAIVEEGTFTSGSRVVQATVAAAVHDLTGSIPGTATLAGDLVKVHELSGSVAGSATLTADLTATRTLAGVIEGQSTLGADLVIRRVLTGAIAGTGTLEGALTARRALVGEIGGLGALSGTLTIVEAGVQDLTGQIAGVGTLAGDLTATRALSGAVTGAGTLTGDLGAIRVLSGSMEGFGALAGQLIAVRTLTGSIDGQGTLTGNLVKAIFPFLRVEADGASGALVGTSGSAMSSESAGLVGSAIEGA